MVGFGKSDKYISTDDYSHQMHVDKMTQLIIELDLNLFRKKMINFERKKNTIKQTKKAAK